MFLERTTWGGQGSVREGKKEDLLCFWSVQHGEARGVIEKGRRRTCCVFGAYNMGRPGECYRREGGPVVFLERTTWGGQGSFREGKKEDLLCFWSVQHGEARGVLEKGRRRTCCVFGAYNMGRPGEC